MVLFSGIAGLVVLAWATPAFAGDKEVTVTGEGKCGKCALHETRECQYVIQVEKDGKTVTYYLTKNDVSKEFHDNVCKASKKATATGTVAMVDGKQMLTVSKIELVK